MDITSTTTPPAITDALRAEYADLYVMQAMIGARMQSHFGPIVEKDRKLYEDVVARMRAIEQHVILHGTPGIGYTTPLDRLAEINARRKRLGASAIRCRRQEWVSLAGTVHYHEEIEYDDGFIHVANGVTGSPI